MIRTLLAAALVIAATTSGARTETMAYKGLCEASAGAFIDDHHFVVASDETNRLQLYRRGNPDPIGRGIDMEPFTSFGKSDLEAAAVIGDRVYWTSSHSFNKDGEDKKQRKLFFATRIALQDGKPTLVAIGKPVIATLRDPLIAAASVEASELNIEGLAATPEGSLLIGLRAPLARKKALVIPLRNPAAVVDQGAAPEFGTALTLDLDGRGIRSMDLISRNPVRYVIVAGPVADGKGFAVFGWGGPGSEPARIRVDLGKIRPEGAMAVPGQKIVQLLSDDEGKCAGGDKQKFRSRDITLD